ncbi:flavin reductase family protein [Streptomyces sp. NPDC057939]|uniref:flavin reductase family protein n=1 Tax=Streptomyces sp. NPDC057939 TaxID=3346284 RepID=UPI0036E99852
MSRYPTWLTDRSAAVPAQGYEDPEAARLALRRLASGVTVLTVSQGGVRHGTTASAVVTLSRDPLVLGACLRPTSTFASLVRRAGRFSVNVLSSAQNDVARRFANPGRPLGDAQFEGFDWSTDPLTGAPLLGGSLAHMACRILGWHQVGDHDMLLAEVTGGSHTVDSPMLSFAGRMHSAAVTPAASAGAAPSGVPAPSGASTVSVSPSEVS